MTSHKIFMLVNVPVRDTEKELNINREQIYAKYTSAPLTENAWPRYWGSFRKHHSFLFYSYFGIPDIKSASFRIHSKHVLMACDSCFSGSLFALHSIKQED